MIDQGQRVCFIQGIDKPRVNGLNGKYYFKFIDMVDGAVSAHNQMADRPWEFDELFYWSPELPQIPIKQAHIIKRVLKQATAESDWMTPAYYEGTCTTTIGGKIFGMTLDKMHSLIYPHWYPVPYQAKALSLFFTPRDEWFFKLPDSDPAKYSWRVGLEHLWLTTPDFLKVDPNNIQKGFRHLFNSHYLGT